MRPENGAIGKHGINTGKPPMEGRFAVIKADAIGCGERNGRSKKAMS
jgi:hypothetical protein